MEFKNPKWKSSDSRKITFKINHFNQQMKRGITKPRTNKPITWGQACLVALKYMEKQINDTDAVKREKGLRREYA